MSPHETGDIHVEPERVARNDRDFIVLEGKYDPGEERGFLPAGLSGSTGEPHPARAERA
jgi:hypothetical protein